MIYVFDMDGTLVDSNEHIHKYIGSYFYKHGIDYNLEVRQKAISLGYPGTAEFLVKDYGLKKDVQTITDELKALTTEAYETSIPAKPYAVDLIKRLKKEGHRLFILSASPHTMISPCIKRLGIYDCFEKTWSTEDFNLDKNDPELFVNVAKELCVDISECIMVDDSIVPVTTAKKAGMKVIAVYDDASKTFKDEMTKIADRYLNDLSEF